MMGSAAFALDAAARSMMPAAIDLAILWNMISPSI